MNNYIEQCKVVRQLTMAPMKDIAAALLDTKGDVDAAIQILIKNRAANVADMENRKADSNFVYSYVHNNKVGAMIVLASQTDFVAKNELFTQLAKDICIHIVSNPITPKYVSEESIPNQDLLKLQMNMEVDHKKPVEIVKKIIDGKTQKFYNDYCLLKQKFIKDDSITIKELINRVSSVVGEKIEIKKFTRLSA